MSPRPLAGPRLARVLAIVPYVLAHPGTTIGELAARFRVSQREIEQDLELLPMCGLPPYTADRLIDVWIADDGAVDIRLAEYFERPLRLTPAEGVALVAASRALLAVPGADAGGPLATAVDKLEAVVGVSGRLAIDVGNATHLTTIRDAIERHERVEIDYYSYARDEMTTRRVDPARVFHALGAWYLEAYCHRAEGDRLFRVDRVQAVRATGETFEPRPPGPAAGEEPADGNLTGLVYHPRPGDRRVTLRLAAATAWVADELPVDERHDEADGAVRVVLAVSEDAFLERLLLRLGPEAEVLDPPAAIDLRTAAAARLLLRYADGGGTGS
ncbi:MAG: WYL domain-containing protein [Acidimicrobiia bacterium]|jgi:proteasome accessory factor C